ncbi:MurR/RpiR family transcriptional regulator [Fictibacillus phosphorivorans]|uniref:MurR/RpiR family transcriptional regulator n=1 Tax=Fictibacillus phosphorivorans TaxID=1221500 RepID=UPI00203FF946|nr:MurR/RpiR family transcriptional regulator [Fictibacillus phosphorivorans]MCM3716943.1 MurR/RpiR family transcriptional regulator [Fictibacillus phosphorivorans]MCM3774508.1 MurR/RpiR family transcriptional regulator [Fictibacillus phosphorivorans]
MDQINVYKLIAEKKPAMSKAQEKLASYIINNPNTVPFYNVATLAKQAGVSEASVVRFAVFLGYSGYRELQTQMQNSVQRQLTTKDRLKMSSELYEDSSQTIYKVFEDDIANLKSTMENLDSKALVEAVNHLLTGKEIYISANRSAASIGLFMHYYLDLILENTILLGPVENKPEQLIRLSKKDVVVGISFARYTKSTVNMMSFAKERGATTIAITDNLLSPIVPYADVVLTASSQVPTFFDSFVAPLSLINTLLASVGKERMKDAEDRLEKMEEFWERFDTFYSK